MAGRDVRFGIFADDRASRTLAHVGAAAQKSGEKIAGLGKLAKSAGVALAAFGTAGLGKELFDTAVNVEAMGNKARVVFGEYFPAAQKTAEELSTSLGMSTTEVLGLTAGFGDLLTPMGFTQKQAQGMTDKMGYLTAALTQWSGGTKTAADVGDILADALVGEYDSLKSLGVQLDAATVDAKMAAAGKSKLTGAAQKQAQAEIVLDEIYKQSSNAIAGYEKKTNKLGLAKNKLSSSLKNIRDTLAAKLIPTFAKVAEGAQVFLDALTGKSELNEFSGKLKTLNNVGVKLYEGFQLLWSGLTMNNSVAAEFGDDLEGLVLVGRSLRSFWENRLVPAVKALWGAGKKLSGWVKNDLMPVIRETVQKWLPVFKKGWEDIKAAFGSTSGSGTGLKTALSVLGKLVEYMASNGIRNLAIGVRALGIALRAAAWVVNSVVLPAIRAIWSVFSTVIGDVLEGAATAFGWVPGLGPKLRTAADQFRVFRDNVNAALNGIKDRYVTVNVRTVNAGKRNYIQKVGTGGSRGGRASGGGMEIGATYQVNEDGQELLKMTDRTAAVIPHRQSQRMLRADGGGATYHITVQGAVDPVSTARQIERILSQARRVGTLSPMGA